MKCKESYYLPSGRVFVLETNDNYFIECTEMRDVSVQGKDHFEVRTSNDPKVIWKHLQPFEKKLLMTVSTQKGCTHNCKFCDAAPLPFKGNLSEQEITGQIVFLLNNLPYVEKSDKVKIGFARMGEPSHNLDNVLSVINNLDNISTGMGKSFRWLPCFNSILPIRCTDNSGVDVLHKVIDCKEQNHNGYLHFQISCNSTDEKLRKQLFGGANVLSLQEIVKQVNTRTISNRTVTLNFIVMENVPVDVEHLMKLGLNPDKFAVKLIPLNTTNNAVNNDLNTYANYNNLEKLEELESKFKSYGVPVVMDAIARCEEGGLCCGQLVSNLNMGV